MEDNELEKLEEFPNVKRILERSKVLMEQENREMRPKPFAELESEIDRRNVAPLSRFTFSLWKLAAACVVGVFIGWFIPEGRSDKDSLIAKVDTVIVTERCVDTVYKEVPVVHEVIVTKRCNHTIPASGHSTPDTMVTAVDSSVLLNNSKFDLPDSGRRGRSVSKENFPFHLLVSM